MKALAVLILAGSALAQLPNPATTPGVIRTSSAAEICAPKFRTKPFRNTTKQMKLEACESYRFTAHQCPKQRKMEIDHLVPLELGGLDDVRNLWPQLAKYADGSPGFHVKDKLENALHRQVCAGKMDLAAAQRCIREDWISCYSRVLGKKP